MPGCATHYLFGVDVYHSIDNKNIQNIIKQHTAPYRLGLQGPDLFFYHLPYLKYNNYRNIGSYMHGHQVQDFFEKAFLALPTIQGTINQEICCAWLSGFLCHYILDYTGHPFVYARINYSANEKNRSASGEHAALELEIDRYYLKEKREIPLTKFHPYINFALSKTEVNAVSDYMSFCMKNTFSRLYAKKQYPITPNRIRFIIKEAKIESVLQMDPKNRKSKTIARFEDKLVHYRLLTYKFIADESIPIYDCLNKNHERWNNPWNPKLFSNDSFDDIYSRALEKCFELFRLIDSDSIFTVSGVKKQLPAILEFLGDRSYYSGL